MRGRRLGSPQRQLLDSDNWVDISGELLENEAIRGALAGYLVNVLYQDANVQQRLEERSRHHSTAWRPLGTAAALHVSKKATARRTTRSWRSFAATWPTVQSRLILVRCCNRWPTEPACPPTRSTSSRPTSLTFSSRAQSSSTQPRRRSL